MKHLAPATIKLKIIVLSYFQHSFTIRRVISPDSSTIGVASRCREADVHCQCLTDRKLKTFVTLTQIARDLSSQTKKHGQVSLQV